MNRTGNREQISAPGLRSYRRAYPVLGRLLLLRAAGGGNGCPRRAMRPCTTARVTLDNLAPRSPSGAEPGGRASACLPRLLSGGNGSPRLLRTPHRAAELDEPSHLAPRCIHRALYATAELQAVQHVKLDNLESAKHASCCSRRSRGRGQRQSRVEPGTACRSDKGRHAVTIYLLNTYIDPSPSMTDRSATRLISRSPYDALAIHVSSAETSHLGVSAVFVSWPQAAKRKRSVQNQPDVNSPSTQPRRPLVPSNWPSRAEKGRLPWLAPARGRGGTGSRIALRVD